MFIGYAAVVYFRIVIDKHTKYNVVIADDLTGSDYVMKNVNIFFSRLLVQVDRRGEPHYRTSVAAVAAAEAEATSEVS